MPNPETERTSDLALASVQWLRDPGGDVSCGPVPCDVDSLHGLLDQALSEQVREVAVHGVVRAATQLGDGWQLAVSPAAEVDDQELRVLTPAVTEAARCPGVVVRAWGVIELTSRFEVRLRADEIAIVETSAPDG